MEKLLGLNMSQKLIAAPPAPDTSPPSPSRPQWPPALFCNKCVECWDIDKEFVRDVHYFRRKFINKQTGEGLVATGNIPAGSIIFADELISVNYQERIACVTYRDMDELISKKVKAMDPAWQSTFMNCDNPDPEEKGSYGGIWDKYSLGMTWNGKPGGVLGLNLAYVNHSCAPNSHLTFFNRYPHDENGQEQKTKPVIGRAVVRAVSDILKGQEITIAYFYARGTAAYRQAESAITFDWRCACWFCLNKLPPWENTLERFKTNDFLIDWKEFVDFLPAVVYQSANDVITRMNKCRIADLRLTWLWVQCGLVAGYHSDLARALCFLTKARKMAVFYEGPTGIFYRQIARWCDNLTSMPGFGGSTVGVSTIQDAMYIFTQHAHSKEILFMVGAHPNEYLRVNRYILGESPDEAKAKGEHVYTILPPRDETERYKLPDGITVGQTGKRIVPLGFAAKKVDRTLNSANTSKKVEERVTIKPKKKVKKSNRAAKEPCEKCRDPERDLLDIARILVKEMGIEVDEYHPEMTPAEEADSIRTDPNALRKIKAFMAQYLDLDEPEVKTVEARRKVTVAKSPCLATVEEESAELYES